MYDNSGKLEQAGNFFWKMDYWPVPNGGNFFLF